MADDIEEMTDLDNETTIKDDAGAARAEELPASEGSSASPDASKPEGEEGPLSAVRDVVAKRQEPDPTASSASDEDPAQKADDQPTQTDDENYSDVPFNKHPRFQQVLGRLKASEQDATRYRNVQNFLDQNGLGAEEAAELLAIGGLMKTDPAEAWRRMQPAVQKLLVAAGEVLPEDLRQRVQNGSMNRETAIEISRLRAREQSHGVQATFREQQAERQRQQELAGSITGAVQSWEADRRQKDPNFEAKHPALLREVAYLQQTEGRPSTPHEVQAQLKKAYDAVNASFQPPRPTAPQPRATQPLRGGNAAGNPQPKPNSTLDIVNATLAKRQAG